MLGSNGLCAGIGTAPRGWSCLTISGGSRKSRCAAGKGFLAISWADLDFEATGARFLTGAFFSLATGFAGEWTVFFSAEVVTGCTWAAVATTALSALKTPTNSRPTQYVAFITPTVLTVQVRMLALYAQGDKVIMVKRPSLRLPRFLRRGPRLPGRAGWQACPRSSRPDRLRGSRVWRSLVVCSD